MKIYPAFIAHGLGALALAGSLTAIGAPAPTDTAPPDAAAWQSRIHERIQTRLNDLATRLQINAAQQDAWNAYAATVQSLFDARRSRPAADADAATIARLRAEAAMSYAQKLAQLADATATLQETLTPEQRKTLDETVRRHHRPGHAHGR